jgi:hypothetical protein
MDFGPKDFSHIYSSSLMAKVVWQWLIFGLDSARSAVAAGLRLGRFRYEWAQIEAPLKSAGVAAKTRMAGRVAERYFRRPFLVASS